MTAAFALLGLAGAGGAGSLSVTASPAAFGGSRKTDVSRTFGPCTLIPAGGSGSYTYAWTVVSTDTSVGFSAPSSASSNITISSPGMGNTSLSTVRGTVTDTVSGATGHVNVALSYTIIPDGLPES